MGKHGKALKKRRLEQQAAQATLALADGDLDDFADENEQSPPSSATVDLTHLGGLVTPSQLALTVKTLDTLSKHSELLANKEDAVHLRPLRRAVHDFHRTANQLAGTGNSLSSRISAALTQHRHLDALVLLAELRLRGQSPKLGSLQRWVRDLDAASRDDGSFGDSQVLTVLDAILRCTNGEPEHDEDEEGLVRGSKGQVVVRQRDWVHRPPRDGDVYAEIVAGQFPREFRRRVRSLGVVLTPVIQPSRSCEAAAADRGKLSSRFSLLHTVPASERQPPNHHPALLFASAPNAIPLAPSPPTPVQRFDVPHVPGAFLLTDVLSPDECRSILAHAEAVGFRPDQPIEGDQSVLAHNLYWLADLPFLDTFCKRFLHLCPPLMDGRPVRGINARFRGESLVLFFRSPPSLALEH
ncbi:MAG: hypothetical protein LBE44_01195 [Microbacterium hominis]|jgi:hypothetical protein|nr:hypothetical protein [Microbacterium hominis]